MQRVMSEVEDLVGIIWYSIKTISDMEGAGHQIPSGHLAITPGVEALMENMAKSIHRLQGIVVGEEVAVELIKEKITTSVVEGDDLSSRGPLLSQSKDLMDNYNRH